MAHREAVIFSQQFATVILEHQRMIGQIARQDYSLSYNSLLVLLTLFKSSIPVHVKWLTDYVILRRKTILLILLDLENDGLVIKTNYEGDRREMTLQLNPEGKDLANRVILELPETITELFWKALPKDEYNQVILHYLKPAVDTVRGHGINRLELGHDDSALLVELLLLWRAMTDKWAKTVRDYGDLSFNEYRLLSLLEELGSLSPHDIANRLLVQRSGISLFKKRLLADGLAQEDNDPMDGRGSILVSTSKGRKLSRALTGELNAITKQIHAHIPDDEVVLLNSWYFRAYSNLRFAQLQK